jgi:hypothetical protein
LGQQSLCSISLNQASCCNENILYTCLQQLSCSNLDRVKKNLGLDPRRYFLVFPLQLLKLCNRPRPATTKPWYWLF